MSVHMWLDLVHADIRLRNNVYNLRPRAKPNLTRLILVSRTGFSNLQFARFDSHTCTCAFDI